MTEARAKVSLREQAEAAGRELTWRYRVYSARVKSSKMTEAEKAREIDLMRAIRDTLRLFADFEDDVRAALRAAIERKRMIEEAEALRDDPTVAAVLDTFPGAAIVGVEPIEQQQEEESHAD